MAVFMLQTLKSCETLCLKTAFSIKTENKADDVNDRRLVSAFKVRLENALNRR